MSSIYSMSSVGNCSRVLAAERLGYEPTPMSSSDEERLKHYTRCETLAAQQITDAGYSLETGGLCPKCGRHGIHVEIDTALFLLVGHLDRRIIIDGHKFPVEIKSLGKTSWQRFTRKQFAAFPDYAGQEVCYLEAEGSPGVYWIMERDSGAPQVYIVNDLNKDINLNLPFPVERITLPISFGQIADKLNMIEITIQDGTLPDGEESESCYWCRYSYLCPKEEKNTKLETLTLSSLIEAAGLYKSGLEMEKTAKEMKDSGKDVLLEHAKQNSIEKYRVGNVSFTYSGQRVKETLDSKILKASLQELSKKYNLPATVPDEIVRISTKVSEPFDSFTIKLLKE